MQLRDNLVSSSGWDIRETRFDAEQLITNGSNYMVGNGYLGYRGTFPEWRKSEYVGCVVSDTYDNADGNWTELCTVPNGLFAEAEIVDSTETRGSDRRNRVSLFEGSTFEYDRALDVRYGLHSRSLEWGRGAEPELSLSDERFASYTDLHIVAQTWSLKAERAVRIRLTTGIDTDIWSLNGRHFPGFETSIDRRAQSAGQAGGELLFACSHTQQRGIPVCVGSCVQVDSSGRMVAGPEVEASAAPAAVAGGADRGPVDHAPAAADGSGATGRDGKAADSPDDGVWVSREFDLAEGQHINLKQYMAVYTGNDVEDPKGAAHDSLERALETGYEALLDEHKRVWDARWERSHIEIDGDEAAQTVLRYSLYQNAIATPMHTDHLPIGARGLSCQAYQGAAFWDQEIFNLPVFLYTEPEVARRILMFRYRSLDGARKKARDLGFEGAFYAWVSSDTGEEICPSFFFKDVLTGRPIRNHFNDWQIHVAPDVAYTVWKYWQATGDFAFIRDYGAEIVFEVAKFLRSRVVYAPARGRYEIMRVLGPDEYHENVDNNPFTNYQTRYVLSRALQLHGLLSERDPEALSRVRERVGFSGPELEEWKDIVERLHIKEPDPHTGLIEQFDGFFDLEDITPHALRERLQDPGEYWGWPNGIAVHTQVSKQADVAQLFALHPDIWDVETMRANFDYYEPRTQHGSSLSYSVYAMVAAWIGRREKAHEYFMRSCTVDLFNTGKAVSGGTFIGGIHTAAAGVAWQIVVFGFAGLVVHADGLHLDPKLPPQWNGVRFLVTFRGRDVVFSVRKDGITAEASSGNDEPVTVHVRGETFEIAPGERARWDARDDAVS
ncbi:MAG: glycosyl hydrolase family 65 protein [bacterium]